MSTPTTGCQFAVTWRMRDKMEPLHATETGMSHLRYWAYCECGYTGPYRTEENQAAEDGADHAFPGWRTLPIMRRREHKELNYSGWLQWEAMAIAVYPSGWFEAGGPVRTERLMGGSRHAPTMGPGGGYDMCARMIKHPTKQDVEQGSLFDTAGGEG
ncbi:DUF6349 family protein [Streptomyces sp. NPDC057554]|uniref:DUF6349 family protein n=1 Tax=Streptomyces sp. NPDC057554 TaxID=3350538 RepID=UPI0036A4B749